LSINKQNDLKVTVIFCVSAFILSHLCFFLLQNTFVNLDRKILDQLFIYKINSDRFSIDYDDTIVHVDLNNTSIKQLDSYLLVRAECAKVIRNLSAMDVSSQVYDFIFPEKMEDKNNKQLVTATQNTDNVYFGLAFEFSNESEDLQKGDGNSPESKYLDETVWHLNVEGDASNFKTGRTPLVTFPDLADVSAGLGFINLFSDKDGVFRRVPLLIRYKDGFYPSLPFRAVCKYLSVSPVQITVKPGEAIILKGAKRPENNQEKDITIPIDKNGNMIINFVGLWDKMNHENFIDVFNAKSDSDEIIIWKNKLSDKIVIVSEVTTGSSDLGPVPMDSHYPLSGIHSNVIHTILSDTFITEMSWDKTIIVELLLITLVIMLILNANSPFTLALAPVTLCTAYLILAALLFLIADTIISVIRPLMMILFSVIAIGLYRFFHEAKEKEVIKRTFETYFPPSVVKKIMGKSTAISTSGKKKEITILFSDIKDFTKLSSEMNPDHIQEILNEYFEAMTNIVFKYEGTLDKFIGDGLMVFFGDPENQPDHALRCVKSALEMQEQTKALNIKWEKEKGCPIKIRIGINTGIAVVGNMGSSRRLSYTALGSNVNLAQRLESAAPVDGILISHKTYLYVKDHVSVRPLSKINAKGFNDPVDAYEIIL